MQEEIRTQTLDSPIYFLSVLFLIRGISAIRGEIFLPLPFLHLVDPFITLPVELAVILADLTCWADSGVEIRPSPIPICQLTALNSAIPVS